jgi:DNA-directed RNA polymerase subunit RPC12/RpoP
MPLECPGMNRRYWSPKDVKDQACPQCGSRIEFWKDDVKRACPRCGKVVFNPDLGNLCLAWCDKAVECLGSMDIEEWKRQTASLRERENGERGQGRRAFGHR